MPNKITGKTKTNYAAFYTYEYYLRCLKAPCLKVGRIRQALKPLGEVGAPCPLAVQRPPSRALSESHEHARRPLFLTVFKLVF
jgi:hypothetical protein